MNYVTAESVTALLPDWDAGGDVAQTNRAIIMANAWLNAKRLPTYPIDEIPEAILQAGAEIAKLAFEGKLYAGRTEGIVQSKRVKADTVEVEKSFASGADGLAISAEEQFALALLAPFITTGFAINTFAMRS